MDATFKFTPEAKEDKPFDPSLYIDPTDSNPLFYLYSNSINRQGIKEKANDRGEIIYDQMFHDLAKQCEEWMFQLLKIEEMPKIKKGEHTEAKQAKFLELIAAGYCLLSYYGQENMIEATQFAAEYRFHRFMHNKYLTEVNND